MSFFNSNYFHNKNIMIDNKIVAYIISQEGKDDNINDIKSTLKDIQVNVVDIEVPKELDYPRTLTKDDMKEIYKFIWCLNDSRKTHSKKHVLLIKSDSIPKIKKNEFKEMMNELIKNNFDITYLTSWNNKQDYINPDKKILVKSDPTNSTQSLLINPKCRDKLLGLVSLGNSDKISDYNIRLSLFLNNLVSNNNLTALAIIPSAFDVKSESSHQNIVKKSCSACSLKPSTSQSYSSTNYTVLYIILGAFLALIITIVIILLVKKKK